MRMPVILLGCLWANVVAAQTHRTPEELQALLQAHRGDFDYLLGDWNYQAQSKEWGPYKGNWSVVRLPGGQILDEFRVTGDSTEVVYFTTTIRSYNAATDQWELVGMDEGNGLTNMGTARKVSDEMHLEQRFGVTTPTPSLWRIRYYNITPNTFSWTADRTTDGGATWEREYLTIEARRSGPTRSLSLKP